jgi:hypothetical protein
MVHKNAYLARTAIELLDFYLCLWESYVTNSAAMIRLEEERRLLQSSNDWQARENGRLHEACTNQALLLWDRRQAFDSIQQGAFEILQSSNRFSNQMSELSRRTHEDAVRASIDSMQSTSPRDNDSWISQKAYRPFARSAGRHVTWPSLW